MDHAVIRGNGLSSPDQAVVQPLMIAFLMIVDDVLGHGLLEVPLAEGNDAIKTFSFEARTRYMFRPSNDFCSQAPEN